MLYFKFSPAVSPGVNVTLAGKTALILRWSEDPSWRTLTYGVLKDVTTRTGMNSKNQRSYEVHLRIGSGWNELASGDEVFIYDSQLLSQDERDGLMRAIQSMLIGESGVVSTEVDAAVSSIMATYRS